MILTPETREALNGQCSGIWLGQVANTLIEPGTNLIEDGVLRHKKAKERIDLGPLRTDSSKR
jgi:hypothetical protein